MMQKMRAAEALRLGSLVMEPLGGTFVRTRLKYYRPLGSRTLICNDFLDDGEGCAVGMINKACGVPKELNNWFALVDLYPWMSAPRPRLLCPRCGFTHVAVTDMIPHIFDTHVAANLFANGIEFAPPLAPSMTIEQLADWLDSVDPTPRTVTEELAAEIEAAAIEDKEVAAPAPR